MPTFYAASNAPAKGATSVNANGTRSFAARRIRENARPLVPFDFSKIQIQPKTATGIQAKLAIGESNDAYEQEADRVAERVMHMPEPELHGGGVGSGEGSNHQGVVREAALDRIQTKPGDASSRPPIAAPPIVNEVLKSPGQPLDAQTRAYFEPRFGHDFGRVRVHADARAGESARAVNALAYTADHDIVVGAGQSVLGTLAGKRLLAHELTHVMQQTARLGQPVSAPVIQREPVKSLGTVLAPQMAVDALKPNAKGFDVSNLTVALINGIMRAEAGVLKDRWIESSSVGDTQGPGQLGKDKIDEIDKTFVTARQVFAAAYSAPPETWQDKTNDPNWAYFYTAAAYLLKLDVAQKNFQPKADFMAKENAAGTQISDQAMGIHELGLVTYHGGFDRIAAYRRRIAGDTTTPTDATPAELTFRKRFGIIDGFKRWQVTNEIMLAAIREDLFMQDDEDRERLHEMETYLQNVAGGFDFEFDVAAYLEASRRFFVSQGTVKIESSADFPEGLPGTVPADYYTYDVQLYSDSSDLLSSRVDYATATFRVGAAQTYRWPQLPAGHYRFSVHKRNGPVLHGTGRVEFQ